MKAHESVDESVACARGVDNGFDEPTVASCVETSTRLAAVQETARVRGGRFPTPAALPTGCATRFQQTSCGVRSGLTSHLGHIACLLVTVEKFPFVQKP